MNNNDKRQKETQKIKEQRKETYKYKKESGSEEVERRII